MTEKVAQISDQIKEIKNLNLANGENNKERILNLENELINQIKEYETLRQSNPKESKALSPTLERDRFIYDYYLQRGSIAFENNAASDKIVRDNYKNLLSLENQRVELLEKYENAKRTLAFLKEDRSLKKYVKFDPNIMKTTNNEIKKVDRSINNLINEITTRPIKDPQIVISLNEMIQNQGIKIKTPSSLTNRSKNTPTSSSKSLFQKAKKIFFR